jgi:YesN/AraC family two-component response regulator
METEKPFTYSSLKLNQLAKMIGTTPNYLSQVINEERDQNFYNFVNGYRIEEAKRMIQDPANEQVTLLSIAYDVGFNSKSAFNTAFKKYTGTTPSQFRKNSA